MKKTFLFLLISLLALGVSANDGVFTTNGSQLVPIEETDIQLKKEVQQVILSGYINFVVKKSKNFILE